MHVLRHFTQVFILLAFHTFHNCFAEDFTDECNTPLLPLSGIASVAYDHFYSLPDGSWNSNTGLYASVNVATPLSLFSQGIGIQVGGSYGIYDWTGRASVRQHHKETQQQGFVTAGFFRETLGCSGINFGIVYDWMGNKNMGVFALNPHFDQIRLQVGYFFNGTDEIGVWGTIPLTKSRKTSLQIPVSFRAIGQASLFWKHTYSNCAWTMLWAGAPYNRGLLFSSGRAGQFLIGASFSAPLTECLSITGHGVYMMGRSKPSFEKSIDDAANICFGLTYSFGNTRPRGKSPYMPLADNSNFIADTSQHF